MKKTRRNYWLGVGVTWVAFALILGVFTWLAVFPQRERIAEVERSALAGREQFETLSLASSDGWREERESELSELRERVNDFVAEFSDSSHFSFVVSEMARSSQVESLSSKPVVRAVGGVSEEASGGLGEQRLRLSFRCDFEEFVELLNRLERHRPVVFVDQFIVESDERGVGKLEAEMELAVIVKRAGEQQDAG